MATPPAAPVPPPTTADPTQRRFRGCAKIEEYELTEKLGEGTFGVVTKGRSRRTGAIVALKKIIIHNEKDGFPITALREIKLLKMLSHVNILKLDEMAVERHKGDGKKRATLYMVTPYMDHDLSGMTTNPDIRFHESMIKCYMLQLLEGLRYLHDSHILHRDMKAANILINNKGVLQIADFGLARHYEGQTPQPGRGSGEAVRDYTALVVTRWYRPPELLLSLRRYTPAIDMWGAGCVFAELYERRPILEGKTDLNQAQIIFELVGSPNNQSMPGWQELPGCEGVNTWENQRGNIAKRFAKMSPEGLSLLKELLRLDWRKRINAIDALQHPYFTTAPLPAQPENLPRFEASHELDRRKHHEKRTAPPAAPAGGDIGMGPEESWNNANYANGHAAGYDSRGRPYPTHRDRGPPGASNRARDHYESRVPPPPAYDGHAGSQGRPAWARGPDSTARAPPPYANGTGTRHDGGGGLRPPPPSLPPRPRSPNGLPPRPPPVDNRLPPLSRGGPGGVDANGPSDARGPAPSRGGGGGGVDTYIPSYSSARPDERPGAYGGRRGSRDHAFRDRDVPPAGYRDRDGGGGGGGGRDRRTRSRSPERDRERRERLQDRERDFYRSR